MDRIVTCPRSYPPGFLQGLADAWPPADWPGWVHYDGERGHRHKRASDQSTELPEALAAWLFHLARSRLVGWFGASPLIPDLGLWGAGLHEVLPGGSVARHLDADHHPRLGLERALSVTQYIHPEWQPEWGGELELYSGRDGPAVARIVPEPGMLVALDVRGEAWHAVAPVTGPEPRRSLALFFYGRPDSSRQRPRAVFADQGASAGSGR